MKDNRILVVDDTASIHEDFRKILAPTRQRHDQLDEVNELLLGSTFQRKPLQFTYELDSAFQTAEAVEMVRQSLLERRPYSLAFVDVLMPPGDDGLTAIKQMWSVDPDIQCVICTAYTKYGWEDIVGQLGHSDQLFILKKPFDNIEILQLASSLTKRWALNRQLKASLKIKNERAKGDMEQSANAFQDAVDALAAVNKKLKDHLANPRKDDSSRLEDKDEP